MWSDAVDDDASPLPGPGAAAPRPHAADQPARLPPHPQLKQPRRISTGGTNKRRPNNLISVGIRRSSRHQTDQFLREAHVTARYLELLVLLAKPLQFETKELPAMVAAAPPTGPQPGRSHSAAAAPARGTTSSATAFNTFVVFWP